MPEIAIPVSHGQRLKVFAHAGLDWFAGKWDGRALLQGGDPIQRGGVVLVIDRERCFGVFEGLLYAELAAAQPEAFCAWKARELDARYPPGVNQAETLREFSARVLATIDRLAATGTHRKVALVTHGGVLECAYRAATGTSLQSERSFDILNASVNRLHWTPAGMQVVAWGDVRHLQEDPLATGVLDEIDR